MHVLVMEPPGHARRRVIANLPAFPCITVKIVDSVTGKSNVTALNALGHLTEKNILTRHTNRRRGDSWEAKELSLLSTSPCSAQVRDRGQGG